MATDPLGGIGAILEKPATRIGAVDPTEPDIVVASAELPADAEDAIRNPKPLFAVEPPDILELRRMFNEARDMTQEARKLQQQDRDYYDGKQLKGSVVAELKARGQPAIVINRIRPAIDGILGVMQGSQVDPRAYPRNPVDEQTADVATKTLRYIADQANFDSTKLDAAETFWIEGVAAVIIEGGSDSVDVTQIRWEEFFYDPRSRRSDFKDARYLGFAKWMYADAVRGLYPDAYEALGDPVAGAAAGTEETWMDRPDEGPSWVDPKSRRILVVSLFYEKGGQWYRCVYCAAGAFDHDLTGYTDKRGNSICPIEAQSCYVDRENARYGRVRDMVMIQDEINARRSRLLFLAISRQIQPINGDFQPVDVDEARREAATPNGVIPMGYQIVPTADLASGQNLLLQESKGEIERMGPTPAVLGRQGGASESGRARMVLQQAGMTELARPMGRLEDWELRCYRQMWMRAQQLWTDPMWIRVTDQVNAPEFLKVNEPVMGMVMQPVAGPDGQPQLDQMGQPAMMPAIAPVSTKNRLAEMDMDITVDVVPDSANLQQEVFGELMGLVNNSGGLEAITTPQFEWALKASTLQNKSELLESLKALREQMAQGQQAAAEAAQQAAALEAAERQAKIGQTEAQTAKIQTDTLATGFRAGMDSVKDMPDDG